VTLKAVEDNNFLLILRNISKFIQTDWRKL